MNTFLGLLIPFAGTTAGAACVFFLRGQLKAGVQKALLGFASGVMVAASVWSLLIPAMDMSSHMDKLAFLPAALGLLLGIGFLLAMDRLVPHLHLGCEKSEGPACSLKKTTMLVLAVTLHNIPEGMAVGVVFAGMISQNAQITLAGAFALSVGKAFLMGTLSGVVEPIAGGVTVLLASYVEPVLPYLLSFAAGAMLYVVVEELIPESSAGEHSNIGTIGFAAGFVLMMILDVALG